jgi:hypothetical protein
VSGGTNSFTWTNGTWEQTSFNLSINTGNQDITSNGAIRVTGSASLTIVGSVPSSSAGITGTLFINTSGNINIGTGGDSLAVDSGGNLQIQSGTANVIGQVRALGGSLTISGGQLNIDPQDVGGSLTSGKHTFEMAGAANVSFTGGTVTIVDPNAATGAGNSLQVVSGGGTKSFAGSTIRFGNGTSTTSGSIDQFEMNAGVTLGSVAINNPSGTNRNLRLVTNSAILSGNLSITAGTLDANSLNLTLAGNWSNSGTFTPGTQTTTFNGTGAQTISGSSSTAFNSLTISNSSSVNLNTNGSVSSVLTLNNDLTTDAANGIVLDATGSTSATTAGSGDVIGNVKRTDVGSTIRQFGNSDVQVTNGTAMGLTVLLKKSHPSGFNSVDRIYTLTVDSGSVSSATLRFHYRVGELNGNTASSLDLYRYNGTAWQDQGSVGVTRVTLSEPHNYIAQTGITAFSSWTLANGGLSPTAVRLASFNATAFNDRVKLDWKSGFEVRNLGYYVYRDQDGRRTRITPSLVAGSALMAGRDTVLTAGFSYTWYDQLPADSLPGVTYWLEDIDLSGARTLHGPIVPALSSGGNKTSANRSEMINELQLRTSESGTLISSGPAAMAKQKFTLTTAQAGALVSLQQQSQIAAAAGVKIAVSKPGWYRVTQPELVAAGLDVSAGAANLQLFADAQEIPIKVSGNGVQLSPSDYIEFYGRGLDSVTDARQTYYLISGSSSGQRINNPGAPGVLPAASGSSSFDYTVERKDRSIYFANLLNGDGENLFGAIVSDSPTAETISLKNVGAVPAGAQAQLEISLVGVSSQAHHVQVTLNGQALGTVDFSNMGHPTQLFSVAASLIHTGDNTLQLTAIGGPQDISLVDVVRITYAHTYTADNDSLLIGINSGATTRVSGFSNHGVRVVDVTDQTNIQELAPVLTAQSDGTFAADVQVPGSSSLQPHILLVFADAQAGHPDSIKHNDPSAWGAHPSGADYLIVTSRDFLSSAQLLAQYRHTQGLAVAVIDVEDIYDEFSFGAHSPTAIREFLQLATTNWQTKPRYVLLLGDASYDPRNYLGQGSTDFVPTKLLDTTQMETSSDDWLADFNNDGVADLAMGRLPARSATDANVMVNKIISYETAPFDPQRGALLVADNSFESSSVMVSGLLPAAMPRQLINRSSGSDPAIHTQIVDALNQGPRLVNYSGHGSNGVWTGASLLSIFDAPNLTNASRPSVFTMMTCLNGYFPNAYNDSLAEALLKASNGGAVAVWASTGMTEPSSQSLIDQSFYQQLSSGQAVLLGDAVHTAKLTTTDPDVRRTWTLFGDPATRVVSLTPTATNGSVGGIITDGAGQPLAGTTIALSGAKTRTTITDSNGSYGFDNLETNVFYTITPARPNYSFTPGSRSFSLLGLHTDASFVATAQATPINPLDATDYFVRQQYLDFLGREPDESGFNFWSNQIRSCGNDATCLEVRRINTSAAFFLSIEFQQTGYLVYRTYKSAYGNMPNAPVPVRLEEFLPDTKEIGQGVVVNKTGWETVLENNKQAFMSEFVQRSRFASAHPETMTPAEFVDRLFANAEVTPVGSQRAEAISEFGSAANTSDLAARARALRRVGENQRLAEQESNRAFVLMQYFGYLRRNPIDAPESTLDYRGYNFWLDKLNAFNGNFANAEMVKAFLLSGEYRQRFGQ